MSLRGGQWEAHGTVLSMSGVRVAMVDTPELAEDIAAALNMSSPATTSSNLMVGDLLLRRGVVGAYRVMDATAARECLLYDMHGFGMEPGAW